MSQIQKRQPPTREGAAKRPLMALDQQIVTMASERPLRPVTIAKALRAGDHPDITTQRVVSRLKALVARGFMERIRPQGGPANGPGTSVYRTKPQKETEQP